MESVLQFLREHLRRDDLRDVADAALALGLDEDSVVRLQYAQALVDSGGPSGALLLYRGVLSDPGASERGAADRSPPAPWAQRGRGGTPRPNSVDFLFLGTPSRQGSFPLADGVPNPGLIACPPLDPSHSRMIRRAPHRFNRSSVK